MANIKYRQHRFITSTPQIAAAVDATTTHNLETSLREWFPVREGASGGGTR